MSNNKYDHDVPFEAYITNLGKYNEGNLVGEWVKFPTTQEEFEGALERIGIGSTDEFGVPYEEFFVTDYDIYVDGLEASMLGEYPNYDELNYLATKIEELNEYDYKTFCAACESGEHTGSEKEIINLIENLDCFNLYSDITSYTALGEYYVDEFIDTSSMGALANYIDYESYGRDIYFEETAEFTEFGYLREDTHGWVDVYEGPEDIPSEVKIWNIDLEEEEQQQ